MKYPPDARVTKKKKKINVQIYGILIVYVPNFLKIGPVILESIALQTHRKTDRLRILFIKRYKISKYIQGPPEAGTMYPRPAACPVVVTGQVPQHNCK